MIYDYKWIPGSSSKRCPDPSTRMINTVVQVEGLTVSNLPELAASIERSRVLRRDKITKRARVFKAQHRYLLPATLTPNQLKVIEDSLKHLAPLPELWLVVMVNRVSQANTLVNVLMTAKALRARVAVSSAPEVDMVQYIEPWFQKESSWRNRGLIDGPTSEMVIEQLILKSAPEFLNDPKYLYALKEAANKRCPIYWGGWENLWPYSEFRYIPARKQVPVAERILKAEERRDVVPTKTWCWYPCGIIGKYASMLQGEEHSTLLWRSRAVWKV